MSKKNSAVAKRERREKLMEKRNKFSNPVERPDDCLRHFGFVPNEDFFKHAAIAWCDDDMKLALRSKKNLLQCREEGLLDGCGGRAVSDFIYLSFFRTGNYDETNVNAYGRSFFSMKDIQDNKDKMYYIYRPIEYIAHLMGRKNHSSEVRKKHMPFYHPSNTIMFPLDKLEELPDKGFTREKLIDMAKWDERVSPLNEVELDNLLANSKESALRENYIFNEDGLVIEEFAGVGKHKGETFYQPKKKDETWERCFTPHPFKVVPSGIAVADYAATHKTINIHNGSMTTSNN